jgi:restriction endonuclease S subunit
VKLSYICTIKTGLVLHRKKAAAYDDIQIPYKLLSLKAFNGSTSLDTSYVDEFMAREEIDDNYTSQVGDIIVRLRAPIQAVYIDEDSKGMIVPSLMSIIRLKDDTMIDAEYIAYYLNSTGVQRALQKSIKGTTINMLKTTDLNDIDMVLPPIQIQKDLVTYLKLSEQEISLLEKLKVQKANFAKEILDTMIKQTKERTHAKN